MTRFDLVFLGRGWNLTAKRFVEWPCLTSISRATERRVVKTLNLLFASALVTACANPINQHTSYKYQQAGDAAVAQGDLHTARIRYGRALANAQLGRLGPVEQADILMKLGQINGNLCQHDVAEKNFNDATSLYAKAYGETSSLTFRARLELAQFTYDIGRYERAVPYFEKALPIGGELLENGNPKTYAEILDSYAEALKHIGRIDDSVLIQKRAKAVRAKIPTSPRLSSTDDYVPYPKTCK